MLSSKQKKDEEKRKKDHEREVERLKREEEKQEKLRQKEAEKLKRDEEKRKKDEEKEQERLKKEEERVKKEEEKRKKDAEREQERLKKDEEKRKKEEEKEQERLKREDEKRKKEEEKEQQRLKREEEREKKETERKQKQEEKDREKLKLEEKANKQADFLKSFLNKTPVSGRKSGGTASANQSANTSILDSSAAIEDDSPQKEKNAAARSQGVAEDADQIEVSENDDGGGVPCPKIPRLDFHPMPFQVKNGMALAPVLRRASLNIFEKHSVDKMVHPTKKIQINLTDLEAEIVKENAVISKPELNCAVPIDLDSSGPICAEPIPSEIIVREIEVENAAIPVFTPYLELLKKGLGRTSSRTEVKHTDDTEDVEILDPKAILMSSRTAFGQAKLRYKLLQFHDNLRPAYWGTWQKPALKIKPRRPFAQEEELDYEFESGDEWEEEPEDGEDLNSDKEDEDKQEEEKEGNEVDPDADEDMDEWMVPHGYLSDEEAGGDQNLDKDKLKSLEEEYYKEHKRQHKLGLPTIETDDLSDYELIIPPPKKRKRSNKMRKAATEFNEMSKTGNLVSEGIELSSDEEDGDWQEINSNGDGAKIDAEKSDSDSSNSSYSSSDGDDEDSGSEDDLMIKKDGNITISADETDADDEDNDEEVSMDSADADTSASVSMNNTDNSEVEDEEKNDADEDEAMQIDDASAAIPVESLQETKPAIDSEPGVAVQ